MVGIAKDLHCILMEVSVVENQVLCLYRILKTDSVTIGENILTTHAESV